MTAAAFNWKPWPVLALGFRAFYLAGALSAVILLPLWLVTLDGHLALPVADPLNWHAHEMLFGFAAAILAGFLFTAVRHWTGGETPRGAALGALVLLWLAGRLAPFVAPPTIAAAIDLVFLPAIAIAVAKPIAAMTPPRGQRRPWLPVIVLALLSMANLLHHLEQVAVARALGFGVIALLIAVIAGRVIPSFTMTGAQVSVPATPRRDRIALIVLGVAVALDIAAQVVTIPAAVLAVVNIFAAVVHAARLQQWQSHRALRVPLLAILHIAYAWLPVALGLRGLAALDLVPPALALHALGIGAMAGLMLGMMTRSSLGHTGRPLRAGRWEIAIYAAITLAAGLRLCAGLHPDWTQPLLCAAGLAWEASFGLFLLRYTPILLRARIDGKPG
jgi:uncharacterized protein involved in response to NO